MNKVILVTSQVLAQWRAVSDDPVGKRASGANADLLASLAARHQHQNSVSHSNISDEDLVDEEGELELAECQVSDVVDDFEAADSSSDKQVDVISHGEEVVGGVVAEEEESALSKFEIYLKEW